MSGDEYDSEIYRLGTALYGLAHYDHIVEAVRKSFWLQFLFMLEVIRHAVLKFLTLLFCVIWDLQRGLTL